MTHAPASLNVTSAPAPPSSDWLALTKPSLPDARENSRLRLYFSSPAIEATTGPSLSVKPLLGCYRSHNWPKFDQQIKEPKYASILKLMNTMNKNCEKTDSAEAQEPENHHKKLTKRILERQDTSQSLSTCISSKANE
ncbi:hypothetical protein PCANC_19145 [Puccinia coronata f. sp. avenae]|uniref:Uncharacterized protein n=1 Tax=Puccinia coronata f. sp. avenae TaxID=200324 RepID=A0A2N5S302_9BASI|nr:hypothetical protein PCANC_24258 [Puccinia coronata f. sp. avenae]PLW28572.1 hypothetical protein PCANC_19145 [Puccinia coronata f. sp. avenae]